MCGRYTLRTPVAELARQLELFDYQDPGSAFEPRYNIAPSQAVPAVRCVGANRQLAMLRWGLVPSWAKEPSVGYPLINARSETAATRPSFRTALRHRRCLILADGFYEWQRVGKQKLPYYITMQDDSPFAFAGLWEHWSGRGESIESCTMLTTGPNELLRPIHDRMPVILAPQDYAQWLDPQIDTAEGIQLLLRPFAAASMKAYPVSRWVNSPTHEGPRCIEAAE